VSINNREHDAINKRGHAQRAIEAAEAIMRGEPSPAPLDTHEAIDAALRRLLPDHDHFWPRWLVRRGAVA